MNLDILSTNIKHEESSKFHSPAKHVSIQSSNALFCYYFSVSGHYLGQLSQNSKYENLRTTICESVSQLSNVLLGSKNWFKLTA